jgi:hypothetical protein
VISIEDADSPLQSAAANSSIVPLAESGNPFAYMSRLAGMVRTGGAVLPLIVNCGETSSADNICSVAVAETVDVATGVVLFVDSATGSCAVPVAVAVGVGVDSTGNGWAAIGVAELSFWANSDAGNNAAQMPSTINKRHSIRITLPLIWNVRHTLDRAQSMPVDAA